MFASLRQCSDPLFTITSLDTVCRTCLGKADEFESIHKIHNWTANVSDEIKDALEHLMQSKVSRVFIILLLFVSLGIPHLVVLLYRR